LRSLHTNRRARVQRAAAPLTESKHFRRIAAAPAENMQIADMKVALQLLLDRKRHCMLRRMSL